MKDEQNAKQHTEIRKAIVCLPIVAGEQIANLIHHDASHVAWSAFFLALLAFFQDRK